MLVRFISMFLIAATPYAAAMYPHASSSSQDRADEQKIRQLAGLIVSGGSDSKTLDKLVGKIYHGEISIPDSIEPAHLASGFIPAMVHAGTANQFSSQYNREFLDRAFNTIASRIAQHPDRFLLIAAIRRSNVLRADEIARRVEAGIKHADDQKKAQREAADPVNIKRDEILTALSNALPTDLSGRPIHDHTRAWQGNPFLAALSQGKPANHQSLTALCGHLLYVRTVLNALHNEVSYTASKEITKLEAIRKKLLSLMRAHAEFSDASMRSLYINAFNAVTAQNNNIFSGVDKDVQELMEPERSAPESTKPQAQQRPSESIELPNSKLPIFMLEKDQFLNLFATIYGAAKQQQPTPASSSSSSSVSPASALPANFGDSNEGRTALNTLLDRVRKCKWPSEHATSLAQGASSDTNQELALLARAACFALEKLENGGSGIYEKECRTVYPAIIARIQQLLKTNPHKEQWLDQLRNSKLRFAPVAVDTITGIWKPRTNPNKIYALFSQQHVDLSFPLSSIIMRMQQENGECCADQSPAAMEKRLVSSFGQNTTQGSLTQELMLLVSGLSEQIKHIERAGETGAVRRNILVRRIAQLLTDIEKPHDWLAALNRSYLPYHDEISTMIEAEYSQLTLL